MEFVNYALFYFHYYYGQQRDNSVNDMYPKK